MNTSSHYSLVFGQIFLLGSVKKKSAYSRIHQLMKELKEALEYACSHLFLKVPFLFIVLSAIPKCCNSVDIFTRDQLALWVVFPLPAPSSQHLSACICFRNNTINYYFCKFKIPSHFVYCLFSFVCQKVLSINCSLWAWCCFEILLVEILRLR